MSSTSSAATGTQRAAHLDVYRGRARRALPLLRPRFLRRDVPLPPSVGGDAGARCRRRTHLDEASFDAACDGPPELRTVPMWVAHNGNSGHHRHRTAVLFLHGKTESRATYRDLAARFLLACGRDGDDDDNSDGLVLFAVPDMPYHGDRRRRREDAPGGAEDEFEQAVARAVMAASRGDDASGPLLLDWAWDALCALDALDVLYPAPSSSPPMRVVLAGVSMGGSAAMLAALASLAEGGKGGGPSPWRLAGCAPLIALQYWRWGFQGDAWLGRAESLAPAFAAAIEVGGGGGEDSSSRAAAWESAVRRLLPRLLEEEDGGYDAPRALAALRSVPLLACCSATDPRCPLEGVKVAWREAAGEGAAAAAPHHELFVDESARGHELTAAMVEQFEAWLREVAVVV
jgi:hypothetical protein